MNYNEVIYTIDGESSTPAPKKPRPKIEILRHIATLRVRGQCHTELNFVRFDDNDPAFDIRRWHYYRGGFVKASKRGIQLTKEETIALRDALMEEFLDDR